MIAKQELAMKVGQGFSDVGSIPTTSTGIPKLPEAMYGRSHGNENSRRAFGIPVGVNRFRRDSARHWSQSAGDYRDEVVQLGALRLKQNPGVLTEATQLAGSPQHRNSVKQNCQPCCADASSGLRGPGDAVGLCCIADRSGYGGHFWIIPGVLATESLPIRI
jgi:hypothetical protein